MTLQLAQSGRLAALQHRNADRVLVRPARHKSEVKLPEDGTVAAYLIDALGQGSTSAQLQMETGWSKSTVLINLYKVAKKSGIGISRRDDVMHLLLPKGAEDVYPRREIERKESDIEGHAAKPIPA